MHGGVTGKASDSLPMSIFGLTEADEDAAIAEGMESYSPVCDSPLR